MNEPSYSRSNGSRPREDGTETTTSLLKTLQGWVRGLQRQRNGDSSLRETLEELIEEPSGEEPTIGASERTLLINILKVRDMVVEDVMVPRADILAVETDAALDELIGLFNESQHSRLPVYRGTLDDVVGMIHIRDVLACCGGQSKPYRLGALVRKVLFVAPTMRVLDLLLEMRATRTHMALVVDEFGGIDGLVTIEDLVEEIVGEIEDEHDEIEGPALVERPDGSLDATARATIEEFEERVGPVLDAEEREDFDTLGGLVVSLAGRVPGRGELIRHASGVEFEVIDADPRRIKRLRLRNLPPGSTPSPTDATADGDRRG